MIRTNRAVIVEGKYDKIKLENIIDACIIPTNGFSFFKDKEKRELIRRAAKEKGIVVITDSDHAGNMIREYLKNICDSSDIVNVYIPQIKGKEKRKQKPSAEGFLGVEGVDDGIILEAFKRSGINAEKAEKRTERITKQDLYFYGLSGSDNSKLMRKELSSFLKIPENMSSSAFLDAINTFYTKEQFESLVKKWRLEEGKK